MESAGEKQEQEEEIDHQQTIALDLYDLYWFRYLILSCLPPPPPPPSPPPDVESRTSSPPQTLLRRRSLHRRSLSEDLCPSPTLQIRTPKLETILSGKESAISDETSIDDENRRWRRNNIDRRRIRRRRGETSKSMSELEFEELKGFMDLGFTFSDAEKDPRLMEIVPGLQRLKGESAGAVAEDASSSASADDVAVSRPYLSEAWDAVEEEEEEEERRLRNLRVTLMVGDGADLKDQLRYWAQAVASTVR